jgi:hypothetical protein
MRDPNRGVPDQQSQNGKDNVSLENVLGCKVSGISRIDRMSSMRRSCPAQGLRNDLSDIRPDPPRRDESNLGNRNKCEGSIGG